MRRAKEENKTEGDAIVGATLDSSCILKRET